MPAVTVVVPAYNAERTIVATIRSALAQTFRDFELLVVDDGSVDGTVACLGKVDDERLVVRSFPHAGLAAARNRGIEHSRGELIAFLDADDLWAPDKLELQVAALRAAPAAGAAYSWTCIVDHDGRFFFAKEPSRYQGDVYAAMLTQCFVASGSNVLLRRHVVESVGRFDCSLRSAEDWDYWLRVAARWPFVLVPRYQVFYRQHAAALSARVDMIETSNLAVIEKAFARAPARLQGLRAQSTANVYQYLAYLQLSHLYDRRSLAGAGRCLRTAIRHHPPILATGKMQRTVAWWLLLAVLPPRLVRRLVSLHGRIQLRLDPTVRTALAPLGGV